MVPRVLESLRSQVASLEAEIRELEEKVRAKATEKAAATARLQARIFLDRIFKPYIDGLCEGLGLDPGSGVQRLIESETTIDKLAVDNREALEAFLAQTECRVVIAIAGPVARKPDEWIRERADGLLEEMEVSYPDMAKAIIDSPGGREWFAESLIGLREILFGKQPNK